MSQSEADAWKPAAGQTQISDDDGCRTTPGLFGGLTELFDVFGQITRGKDWL
jgi:hypothetical protein